MTPRKHRIESTHTYMVKTHTQLIDIIYIDLFVPLCSILNKVCVVPKELEAL